MNTYLSLIVSFFIASVSLAQDFEMEWSELEQSKGRLIYLLPSDSNEFYALRWTGGRVLGGYQVSKHRDLKLVGSGKIKLQANRSIANFEGARVINGKFMVFLSDKREGENILYMQEYSDELIPKGDVVKLGSYKLDRKRGKGVFYVLPSNNNKYFGIVWEVPGKKDERALYGFKVYDTTMQLINDGEYPVLFHPDLSKINGHHISNTGDYFLAVTEYSERDRKVFQRQRLDYKALHIYHIAEDGLQDYVLELEGKRVEAMAMTSDENDVFMVTGIYGNIEERGVKGVFHQRLDLDSGKKLGEGFKEFSEDLITYGWSEKAIKKSERKEEKGKGEPQLYNYRMREVTIMEDGSIVGTMEQYYVQVQTMTDTRSGQSMNTYYYYYNDILAYKVNPDGEFGWVDKIRKVQVSTNDGGPYSSYETFIDSGKVYFIFNDDSRNYDSEGAYLDLEKLYVANYGKKKNVVAMASIDLATGAKEQYTFFGRSDIEALAVPKLFHVNYSNREVLLYSIWGRKEKIGVLRF